MDRCAQIFRASHNLGIVVLVFAEPMLVCGCWGGAGIAFVSCRTNQQWVFAPSYFEQITYARFKLAERSVLGGMVARLCNYGAFQINPRNLGNFSTGAKTFAATQKLLPCAGGTSAKEMGDRLLKWDYCIFQFFVVSWETVSPMRQPPHQAYAWHLVTGFTNNANMETVNASTLYVSTFELVQALLQRGCRIYR